MYGRLIDGVLINAPKKLEINGSWVWNAPAEEYLLQGWKPVQFTDAPEAPEGYYYRSEWTEEDAEIVQTWVLEKLPDEVDDAEAFNIIFGGEE